VRSRGYEFFIKSDFVFEAFITEYLLVEFREKMIEALVKIIASHGELLLVVHKRERTFGEAPSPLMKEEVKWIYLHIMD